MSWKCPKCSAENQDPDTGEYLLLRIKTAVGETLCKKLGSDSQFWAEPQFTCEPASDGWRIIPNTEAPNETQLNGQAITSTQIVGTGDILSVGKESKGIIKLPLQVNYDSNTNILCKECWYDPFLVLRPVSMEETKGRLTAIAYEASQPKETGSDFATDIVFLVDVTQSMQPALEALKRNIGTCIGTFVDLLCDKTNPKYPGGHWRFKVVGYRDVTDDTAPPLEDNPFVHNDADALKSQLQALQVQGVDKGRSSLLDAIIHLADMDATEKRTRELFVFIFTDAPYHPTTKDGGTIDDILLSCNSNSIVPFIFAPELPCYDQLASIDLSEYEAIVIEGGETGAEALARFAGCSDIYESLSPRGHFRKDPVYNVYNALREHGFTSISSLSEQTGLSDGDLAYGLENCFCYGAIEHVPGGVKVLDWRLGRAYFNWMYIESVPADEGLLDTFRKLDTDLLRKHGGKTGEELK
jgi:hypothetical protein